MESEGLTFRALDFVFISSLPTFYISIFLGRDFVSNIKRAYLGQLRVQCILGQNAMLSHYTSQTGLNVTFDFLKFSQ